MATIIDFYDLGDSNMVAGGADNFVNAMITAKYGVGAKTHYNGAVGGKESDWALTEVSNILTNYEITTAFILHIGTNNIVNHPTDSIETIIAQWKSDVSSIKALLDIANVPLWVSMPPPIYMSLTRTWMYTKYKLLNAAILEWCRTNQVVTQYNHLEFTARDAIGNADNMLLPGDAYHFTYPAGVTKFGQILATATVPETTMRHTWGSTSFPACGFHSWASCWLTGATVTGNADTGTLSLANTDVCRFPVMPIDDIAANGTKVKKVTVVPTFLTGTADIYMRSHTGNSFASSDANWQKTTSLWTADHFVQVKIVGTGAATVSQLEMNWSVL